MFKEIVGCLKEIGNFIVKMETKIGFWKLVRYVLLGFLIAGAICYKQVLSNVIELVNQVNYENHARRMEQRDQLLSELDKLLIEFGTTTDADRILYFEYHNSKENLLGIPFKYVDLVMTYKRYGLSEVNLSNYRDINSGLITGLYETLRKQSVVINHGSQDYQFSRQYSSVYDFLSQSDGSNQQMFINLSGINAPIGLIIIEWYNEDVEKDWKSLTKTSIIYESRINALVNKYKSF